MERPRLVAFAALLVLGAASVWLAARRMTEARSVSPIASDDVVSHGAEWVAETSAPIDNASAQPAEQEPPWVPSGSACRHAVARGTSFARLSDSLLAAVILDGYDAATRRLPATKTVHVVPDGGYADPSWGAYFARDCRGDRVEYDQPLSEALRATPSEVLAHSPSDDADASAEGVVRIERSDVRGSRMAVYAAVAVQYGYYFQCLGFQALLRLDEEQVVVEGVGPAELYGCGDKGTALRLAPLAGRVALLLPISVSTGEEGDFELAWRVSIPEHGALRSVGDVRRTRGAGNGSITTGRWFGSMDGELLDVGSFQVAETWQFVRYDKDGHEIRGATRQLVRSYALLDGGLVASPTGDPTR